MAIIITEELRIAIAAEAFDRLETGRTYSSDDLARLRAEVEFEMTGGEEVIPDPIPENAPPAVGDQIIKFDDLVKLPIGTLLIGMSGESYRVGLKDYTERVIYTQSTSGSSNVFPCENIVKGGSFKEDEYLTIVWLPACCLTGIQRNIGG